jgi:TP901 family phage tail tape measure protein
VARTRIIAGKAVILIDAKETIDKTLNTIRAKLNKFSNTAATIGDNLFRTGFFGSIGSGLVLRQFVKFDDVIKELQVSLGFLDKMTVQQEQSLKGLINRVRELGKTTSYTSQEVGAAAVRLAKAGLGPGQIEKSLQSILDLGRGTSTALDTAADMFVRTMSAFSLSADDADKIVSQFVIATQRGVLDLDDLEAALRYSQGTAGNLNQELSDMLAILVELSNKGLVGSIGGTSTNTAIQNLIKKYKELEGSIVGFKAAIDKTGNINVVETLRRLFDATKNMSPIEQTSLMGDIFNLRGTRAVLAAKDIDHIKELSRVIYAASNEARKGAVIMDSGLGGSIRKATSAIEDMALSLGDTLAKSLQDVLATTVTLTNVLNRVISDNPAIAAGVLASPAIILATGVGFIALSKGLRIAAAAAGLFKSAYQPIANMIAYGTAGQLAKMKGIGGSLPRRMAALGSGANALAGGVGSGLAQVNQARKNVALRAAYGKRLSQLLRIQWAEEKKYARLSTQLLSGKLTNRTYKQLLKDRNDLAMQMARTSKAITRTSTKRANLTGFGTLFGDLIRGGTRAIPTLLKLTSGFLKLLNGIRRFVFSTSGILTIIEFLILFGNKIPFIANGLTRLSNAFSAFFNEIGKLGSDIATGPGGLLGVAFKAFTSGNAGIGFQAIQASLSAIVELVGVRLVGAWQRFKQELGPVYDFFNRLLVTVLAVVDQITTAIGAMIAQLSGGIAAALPTVNGGQGNIAKTIATLIPTIVYSLSKFIVELGYALDKFLEGLAHLIDQIPGVDIKGNQFGELTRQYIQVIIDRMKADGTYKGIVNAAMQAEAEALAKDEMTRAGQSTPESRRGAALTALDRSLKEALDKINAAFNTTTTKPVPGITKEQWIKNYIDERLVGKFGDGEGNSVFFKDLSEQMKKSWMEALTWSANEAFKKEFPSGLPATSDSKAAEILKGIQDLIKNLQGSLNWSESMDRIQAEYEDLHNSVSSRARPEQQFNLATDGARKIAQAIVGSIQTVQRNLVGPKVNYEKLQYEELKKVNQNLGALDGAALE